MAFILLLVGILLAHGVVPWAISLLTRRHGWTGSGPGISNVLGLIWALWYGSAAVFSGFVVFWAVVNFVVVPREERSLEARFGGTYREYKAKKPRWFGTLC